MRFNIVEDIESYFKDSKIRDKEGNLIPFYHGTKSDFTKFDTTKIGRGGPLGVGFYFTSDSSVSGKFGSNTKKVFLNVTNPKYFETDSQPRDFLIAMSDELGISQSELIKAKKSLNREVSDRLQAAGFDGVFCHFKDNNEYWCVVYKPNQIKAVTNFDPTDSDDMNEDISHSAQEFTSANTSINSSKLPAVFNLVQFTPDTINLDYGGGKFDNAAEFLATKNVINLVYDPFNRSSSHNEDVLAKIKEHNGADSATLSNVLNVIKEESIREEVLNNIKQLVKPGAEIYITVYEGDKSEEGRETKAGYQLNRKTSSYLDEIAKIFGEGNVKQKGKLIIAKN